MYHVIGLRRDGKLKLASVNEERPSLEYLERLAPEYTQLLVVGVGTGDELARFEVHASPVWQVELA